ncbi:MAG: phosphatidylserine decarboxylase [Oscillospiraceae bacterium]|nr:phosphatidylserine decarboxylase [Oscillospiraceae bacterium]
MSRNNGTFEVIPIENEKICAVRFLYNTVFGRMILKLLTMPAISKFLGMIMDSRVSKLLIPGFIKKNNIDLSDFLDEQYNSFNDFFVREIKKELRPFPADYAEAGAPCDGKLSAYEITDDSVFQIKNSKYTIEDLLRDKGLADEYSGGVCLIYRLSPDDYHRYVYADDGEIYLHRKLEGVLHTVRPIVHEKYSVFTQNAREYTVFQTENFGKVIQMEVGALFVGRIINHVTSGKVKRAAEKGMFQFGGSTVIMLFRKGAIELNPIFLEHTQNDAETLVKMGEVIGRAP